MERLARIFFILMQGNATPRPARFVHYPKINGMVWPTSNPDLNAIEIIENTLGRTLQVRNQFYTLARR